MARRVDEARRGAALLALFERRPQHREHGEVFRPPGLFLRKDQLSKAHHANRHVVEFEHLRARDQIVVGRPTADRAENVERSARARFEQVVRWANQVRRLRCEPARIAAIDRSEFTKRLEAA